ncbi:hypothetical protein MHBO_000259, partial [Bonamia ostreae]
MMDRYQNLFEFFETQKKVPNHYLNDISYGRVPSLKDFLQQHEDVEYDLHDSFNDLNYINVNSLPPLMQMKDEKAYFTETKKKMEINVLKRHKMRLKSTQDEKEKNYSCKICSKLFKKISHVKSHMQ